MKNNRNPLLILVALLMVTACCSLFATEFSAKVVDQLGRPLAGVTVTVYWLKHFSDEKVDSVNLLNQNYLGRISGPLLDRIDLHIEVPTVKFREISGEKNGEASAPVRERVIAARKRQQKRFAGKPKITYNARMSTRDLKAHCAIDEATLELLKFAMADLNLSARAYDRILKVARTIADLGGSENITGDHVSEAIQYRSLDRRLWT